MFLLVIFEVPVSLMFLGIGSSIILAVGPNNTHGSKKT